MKKTITAAALLALLGAAANANAFWWPWGGWGPWGNGWDNGWFGNGGFDFNFSMGVHGSGWGRHHNYYAPYWGYPYGGYGYHPYAYPYAIAPVAAATPASTEDK